MKTAEELIHENSTKSVEELISENTLKGLKAIYEELYGIPCCHKTKKDIAYLIWYYIQEDKRTTDLTKILQFNT